MLRNYEIQWHCTKRFFETNQLFSGQGFSFLIQWSYNICVCIKWIDGSGSRNYNSRQTLSHLSVLLCPTQLWSRSLVLWILSVLWFFLVITRWAKHSVYCDPTSIGGVDSSPSLLSLYPGVDPRRERMHWDTCIPLWLLFHPKLKSNCLGVAAVFLVGQYWGSHLTSWVITIHLIPSKLFIL